MHLVVLGLHDGEVLELDLARLLGPQQIHVHSLRLDGDWLCIDKGAAAAFKRQQSGEHPVLELQSRQASAHRRRSRRPRR